MGFGDQVIATGLAKGAKEIGKRVAFGDGHRIIWNHGSEEVFRNNPNIARPGDEGAPDIEWVHYYKGNRGYNSQDSANSRWIWNYDFKCIPGEFFFDEHESAFANSIEAGFVLIEPNVPREKSVAPNKDWGALKYQAVADRLIADGYRIAQFSGLGFRINGARQIETKSFRQAAAALSKASLYIGPEGGLHHAAAAVQISAVVLFGGFIPPEATGYKTHTNLTGGAEACGKYFPCVHCREAMDRISVDEVYESALEYLR